MKPRRDEFASLVDPKQALYASAWPVAGNYKIAGGWIYAEGDGYRDYSALSEPDLFLSFARLGARGEPSKDSISRWVHNYGLLKRQREDLFWPWYQDAQGKVILNQAPMKVDDFKAEVRCAHQLLTLYTDIKNEDIDALRVRIEGSQDRNRRYPAETSVSVTELDQVFTALRKKVRDGRRAFQRADGTLSPGNQWVTNDDSYDLYLAVNALTSVVQTKVSNVQLGFEELFQSPQPRGAQFRPARSWFCPELLSSIYLQLYLFVTDHHPMRRCENPACGMPFPLTRKNKRFCSDTCRSNARHYK